MCNICIATLLNHSFVVPQLGTCLSSGLSWLSSGPRQVPNWGVSVLDSVNSVLDWDNKSCLSSGLSQPDYLSSGLRQWLIVSVLDQDNQTISVLDWVVSVEDHCKNSYYCKNYNSQLYHYPVERSLKQYFCKIKQQEKTYLFANDWT
jgi:hypothetical protein